MHQVIKVSLSELHINVSIKFLFLWHLYIYITSQKRLMRHSRRNYWVWINKTKWGEVVVRDKWIEWSMLLWLVKWGRGLQNCIEGDQSGAWSWGEMENCGFDFFSGFTLFMAGLHSDKTSLLQGTQVGLQGTGYMSIDKPSPGIPLLQHKETDYK